MKKLLRPDRFFMLASLFLLFSLSVSAQISRPRLVNPKVDDVASMVIVRPDPTNRSREVKRSHRKKAAPKAANKIGKARTAVKTKTNAPTKSKKKEGNLKFMATTKKKPAAKKNRPPRNRPRRNRPPRKPRQEGGCEETGRQETGC